MKVADPSGEGPVSYSQKTGETGMFHLKYQLIDCNPILYNIELPLFAPLSVTVT